MTASDDRTRSSWAAPGSFPGDTPTGPADADGPVRGSGLAWLGARPAGGAASRPGLPSSGSGPAPAPTVEGHPGRPMSDSDPAPWAASTVGTDRDRPGPGEVMTWLPDGSWISAAHDGLGPPGTGAGEPEPRRAAARTAAASDRRHAGRSRWGRRRLALATAGARLAGWPRRLAVIALLMAAVVVGLRPDPAGTAGPAPVPTADVVVAARDLPAGTVLSAAGLRTVPMPVAVTPAGAAHRPAGVVGRVAAGPLRRGEVVTDARVVGPGLATGLGPGETAVVPVRIADPETAALVRAGDRIDLLGTPVGADGAPAATTDEAVEVGSRLRVLAVLDGREPADGVVVVVAATQQGARHLAGAVARHRLTVSVRPP